MRIQFILRSAASKVASNQVTRLVAHTGTHIIPKMITKTLKGCLIFSAVAALSFTGYLVSLEIPNSASFQLPLFLQSPEYGPLLSEFLSLLSPVKVEFPLPSQIPYSPKSLIFAALIFSWSSVRWIANRFHRSQSLKNSGVSPKSPGGSQGILSENSSANSSGSFSPPNHEPVLSLFSDKKSKPTQSNPPEGKDAQLSEAQDKDLRTLAEETRAGLMQLGLNIKCMLREAKALAQATGVSREKVEALSDKNALLMSLIFQIDNYFSNSESDIPRLKFLFGQLKELVDEIVALNSAALDTYPATQKAALEMNQYITKTTTDLLDEAKRVQRIKEMISEFKAAS